jgi:DNA-binding MarR family transcriptional regulator
MEPAVYIALRYKSTGAMAKPKERPLSPKDYRALAEIRRGMRQFLEFSALAAQDSGLTPAQHQALLAIKGMPGPVTVGALAEWLGIKPHSTRDAKDRRRVRLQLTPGAERILAALSRVHRAELQRFSRVVAPLLQVLR